MLLLFSAAFGVALLHGRILERAQASGPTVKRWGGRVLILVGCWFVALGAFSGSFRGLFPV